MEMRARLVTAVSACAWVLASQASCSHSSPMASGAEATGHTSQAVTAPPPPCTSQWCANYAFVGSAGSVAGIVPINLSFGLPAAVVQGTEGSNFYGMAITSDASTMYATNEDEASVLVIDVASNSTTATIPVGTLPIGIAISPNGLYAYVANLVDGTVTPIDITGVLSNGVPNTPLPPIPIANGDSDPLFIAFTPDSSTAYVIDALHNDVVPITVQTSAAGAPIVSTPIPVGIDPTAITMATTPLGLLAYVVNETDGTVTPIDITGAVTGTPNTPLTSITVGSVPNPLPMAIGITPDGLHALVTSQNSTFAPNGDISVIDLATNTAEQAWTEVGVDPVSIVVTQSSAYVANGGEGSTSVTPLTLQASTAGLTITPGMPMNMGEGAGSALVSLSSTPGPVDLGGPPTCSAVTTSVGDPPATATFTLPCTTSLAYPMYGCGLGFGDSGDDALTLTGVYGTITVNGTSATYTTTVKAFFPGTDWFTYQAYNALGASVVASIAVNVVPPCGDDGEACCNGSCNYDIPCISGICESCGQVGETCCADGCDVGGECENGTCQPCGGVGQVCCNGSQACLNEADVCYDGACSPCGDDGEPCCPSGAECQSGLVCHGAPGPVDNSCGPKCEPGPDFLCCLNPHNCKPE